MGKNGKRNGKGFDPSIGKDTQFTSEDQPSPEAKSKGWDRRRTKQEIMDLITKLRGLSMKELEELKDDIKNNPDKHTVLEAKMVQYLSKERFTIDFLDRNVGKAPQDIDVKSDGERIEGITVKFVEPDNGIRDNSDASIKKDYTGEKTE